MILKVKEDYPKEKSEKKDFLLLASVVGTYKRRIVIVMTCRTYRIIRSIACHMNFI
jgi:hypothetical protein